MSKQSDGNPRAKHFGRNLRRLIKDRGLTQKEAAEEIKVPYNWLRKACNDGVARVHPSNKERLQLLIEFFGIEELLLLWSEDFERIRLVANKNSGDGRHEYVRLLEQLLQQFPTHPSVRKILKAIDDAVERVPGRQTQPEERPAEIEARELGLLASEIDPDKLRKWVESPDISDTGTPIVARRTTMGEIAETYDFEPIDQELDYDDEGDRELAEFIAGYEKNPEAYERRMQAERDERKEREERLDEFIESLPQSLTGQYRPDVLRNVVERALRDFDEETLRKKLLDLPQLGAAEDGKPE